MNNFIYYSINGALAQTGLSGLEGIFKMMLLLIFTAGILILPASITAAYFLFKSSRKDNISNIRKITLLILALTSVLICIATAICIFNLLY